MPLAVYSVHAFAGDECSRFDAPGEFCEFARFCREQRLGFLSFLYSQRVSARKVYRILDPPKIKKSKLRHTEDHKQTIIIFPSDGIVEQTQECKFFAIS